MRLLAAALALAAPQPIAVARHDDTSYALAGDRAVYATDGARRVTLRSVGLGSGERAVVDRVELPPEQQFAEPSVAASPQRVALGIVTEDDERYFRYTGVFGGPPGGPLEALDPFEDAAESDRIRVLAGVDADRTFVFDVPGNSLPDGFRYFAHQPGEPDAALLVPERNAFVLGFAGDRVAYFRLRGKLVVGNWRTGEVERTIFPYDPDRAAALRADGAVAYVRAGWLRVALPGQAPRRLLRVGGSSAGDLAWAGDRVVLPRRGRLAVVSPDGSVRALGSRSGYIQGVVADADHVMWRANDCILAARLDAGPADAPGPGPCLRTEIEVNGSFVTRRRGVATAGSKCIAGPGDVCRVSFQLRRRDGTRSRVRRLRIPAGARRYVRFRGRGGVREVVSDPGGRRVIYHG